MLGLLAIALAIVAAVSVLLARQVRKLLGDVEALGERVRDLSARLDSNERDVTGALARTEAAEAVLLDKGLADEEDLEAARRRFDDDAAPDVRDDGELH